MMTSLNITGVSNVTHDDSVVDVRCEMKVAMAVTFLSGIIQVGVRDPGVLYRHYLFLWHCLLEGNNSDKTV